MVIKANSCKQIFAYHSLDGHSLKRRLHSSGVTKEELLKDIKDEALNRRKRKRTQLDHKHRAKPQPPPPDQPYETVAEVLAPLYIRFDMSSFIHRSRAARKPTDCAAIFVHAGAGYHSITNEAVHLAACEEYVERLEHNQKANH